MPILFDHILLDPNIITDGNAQGSPEYANTMIKNPGTGINKINITRFDAQHVWNFDFRLLSTAQQLYLQKIWRGGYGSAYGLRVRLVPDFFVVSEVLGISDGTIASRTWYLTKTYNRPGTTGHGDIRRIIMPVVNAHPAAGSVALKEADGSTTRAIPSIDAQSNGVPAFSVFLDGVLTTAYTIDNTTGILILTSTPPLNTVVTYSAEFDTPMRFFQNSFQQTASVAAEVTGIQMVEILPAEFGL